MLAALGALQPIRPVSARAVTSRMRRYADFGITSCCIGEAARDRKLFPIAIVGFLFVLIDVAMPSHRDLRRAIEHLVSAAVFHRLLREEPLVAVEVTVD